MAETKQMKKWDELEDKEKKQIEMKVNNLREDHLEKTTIYSAMLYKWLFILNAGGLVGTLTLLSVECKTQMDRSPSLIYIILFVLFLLGILSIMYASSLEKERFSALYKHASKCFQEFKNGNMTESYFFKQINEENYPFSIILWAERLSIIFFIIGIIVGTIHLS